MSGREPLPSPSAAELRPGMPMPVSADNGSVSVSDGAKSMQVEAAKASSSGGHDFLRRRGLVVGTLGVLALAAALWFGIPWIRFALSTVSTDDAFVNGHVTFVAPRVHGQVSRVLVDDNNRVHKGDLLVRLDKEPFQDAVAVKKAAVDTAQADLQAARATVRGIEAQAMSRRWKLQHAMENVENQIALLHARVAASREEQGRRLRSPQQEFERAKQLVASATTSRRSTINGRRHCRSPEQTSPGTGRCRTRSVSLWACRRNPRRAEISTKCRPISIRPFLRSCRPRQT